MTWFDILIIILVSVAFLGVIAYLVYRKAKGKGGCDCGCSSCPHCAGCKDKDKRK